MTLAIGVDIGGTKIAAGVVDGQGRILARRKEPTPGRAEDVTGAVGVVVDRLRREYPVAAVGLGGFIDAERETVLFAKNIGWVGEPLRARMERRIGLPVAVENDANAAAWAEARFGAGRGESFLVGLTVGTGIGGGLDVESRLPKRQRRTARRLFEGLQAEGLPGLLRPGAALCEAMEVRARRRRRGPVLRAAGVPARRDLPV